MSGLKGKVGRWELGFASAPKGASGIVQVNVAGHAQPIEVRWARDSSGIWIETPDGVYGFDLDGQREDEGHTHYRVIRRNSSESWEGMTFSRAGDAALAAGASAKKKGVRIRAQMPGKIVRILVAPGATVEKDQPLLVMEAMKMENEIRSPQAAQVKTVKVIEGQAVETGADLVILE